MPEPSHSESKKSPAPGCSLAPHNPGGVHAPPLQPLALFGDVVHACAAEAGLSPRSLRLQSFADRLRATPCTFRCSLFFTQIFVKPIKFECLGLPFSTPCAVVDRKRTQIQQPLFLGMQCPVELPPPLQKFFGEFRPELFGLRFTLESTTTSSAKSHDDDIPVHRFDATLGKFFFPKQKRVLVRTRMKIDVRQSAKSLPPESFPSPHPYSFPILQHAGVQPLLDQPHDGRSATRCSMNGPAIRGKAHRKNF